MAIQTPNGPKANKGEIQQFLKMVRGSFTKNVANAISVILHPCCELTVTDGTYDCDTTEFTLTLSEPQPSIAGFSNAVLVTSEGVLYGEGQLSADGSTVSVLASSEPTGEREFVLIILSYTGGESSGVFKVATGTLTIPTC